MNIVKATARYEEWLGRHLRLLAPDLALKHKAMRSAPFPFLRATYYRWAQVWPEICAEAAKAPVALAVGDLHIENFGTWRDIEGRLIWGINDFDEAWRLPYTNDLIRLATSALLAPAGCGAKAATDALLKGYVEALEAGGRPFALAEHHPILRTMATARLHQPELFWDKLHALPEVQEGDSRRRTEGDRAHDAGEGPGVAHRASCGRAGQPGARTVCRARGLARRQCGARGQGARAVGLCVGAGGQRARRRFFTRRSSTRRFGARIRSCILKSAGSCGGWLRTARGSNFRPCRRNATRCGLLHAMGWETANVHLGTVKARVLLADLKKRPRNWLMRAAEAMEKAVMEDFEGQG